jgi:prepilin-type N-terminal cleavage/methylation domain-containing protein
MGFTLAEILVALALVALLAAVLLPSVAGQILKGDAARVMQDLDAVRAGIDQFVADVHRYPGKYTNLSKAISTSDTDINGATYTAGLVNKWAGPYVTKDTVSAVVPTGYGGNIVNVLAKVMNTNGINYVTILVVGIAQPDFDRIDLQIDGVADSTKGLLRWTAAGSDTAKFLAVPIQ